MSRYKEYENSLRKIILSSADVLKDEVITYLEKVADSNDSKEIEQVLKNSHNLVDYIPHELSDFIANVLIWKPSCPVQPRDNFEAVIYTARSSYLDRPSLNFGIKDDWDYELFDPPSHIHSPFFYLLSKNENAGLNLVYGLTNAATDRWRERFNDYEDTSASEQDCRILPIIINLASGVHEFWGDNEVYCWYRGITDSTPKTVTSALMALEFWMEKQIESDRDPEELFITVLSKSNSVASLGVCLSVTLAYPQKCIKAALPIVRNLTLWSMDISRCCSDTIGRFILPFMKREWVYEILKEHDRKQHRKYDVRWLSTIYLFYSDEYLSSEFEQAVQSFAENLPLQRHHDQNDLVVGSQLQDEIQRYKSYGKRENYKFYKADNKYYVQFNLPEDIQSHDEKYHDFSFQYQQWLSMEMWACKVIDRKGEEKITDLEDMFNLAKQFYNPYDFTSESLDDYYDNTRLAAILSVVSASLILNSKWIVDSNFLEWSQNILLTAANSVQPSIHASPLSKFNVTVAHGLTALVLNEIANSEVRQAILQLIGQSSKFFGYNKNQIDLLKAVFSSLHKAWNKLIGI